MNVQFGYVAIALNLKDSITSKTTTLSNLGKLKSNEEKMYRLKRITKENITNLHRILRYNIEEQIHLYRITSKLVPFATYPLGFDWDYIDQFYKEFKELGKLIQSSNMRISAHPDHFTVINSPDEKVLKQSIKDLDYHLKIFKAMGLMQFQLVVHLGGRYGDKKESALRFCRNFSRLPHELQAHLVLENDDKIFTAEDVLDICKNLQIPMVLDVHHHKCNPSKSLEDLLPEIWGTWNKQIPKIHISSPKDHKKFRNHADYIEAASVLSFFEIANSLKIDFDIMVEAKMKDLAMFKLIEDLNKFPSLKKIDATTIRYNLGEN